MSQTRKHTQRDLLLLSAVCLALASSYCVSSTSSLPQSSLLPSHKSCRQRHPVKPKVKAVVGVLSAAGEPGLGRSQYAYARRRQLLRATWFPASSSDLARHEENGLLLRFLIGQSTSDASETSLQHEQESHGDLWRLPLQETSRLQLHQKVIQFFREATCKYEANYIIKIDDDKYVRLDRLVMSIPQWLSLHAEYVGCFQVRGFFHDPHSYYYDPNHNLLSRDMHIDPGLYAVGTMYAVSAKVAEGLAAMPLALRDFGPNEDIAMGGILRALDVTMFDDRRLCAQTCTSSMIGMDIVTNDDMYRVEQDLCSDEDVADLTCFMRIQNNPRLFSPTAVHACLSPIRPVKRYFHFKAQALGQEHSHVAARDPTLQGLTSRNPLTIRWKPLLLAAVCLGLSVASWVVPNGAQASCFGSAATASPMSAADPEAPQEQTSGHTKVSRSADQYSMDAIDQGLAQPAIRVAVAVGVVISALLILRFTLDRDAPYQPKPHARFSKPVDGTPQGLDPKGAAGAQGSTPAAKLAAADTSAPQRSVPGTGSQLPRQQGLSRAPQTSGEVGYARQSPAAGAPAPSQQQGVGQRPSGGLQQGSGRLPSVPGEPDYVGKRPSNTRPSADQQANRQADSSSPSSASPVTSSTGGFFAQSARPQVEQPSTTTSKPEDWKLGGQKGQGQGFFGQPATGQDASKGASPGSSKSQKDASATLSGKAGQQPASGGFFGQPTRPSSNQQPRRAASPADWSLSGASAGFFSSAAASQKPGGSDGTRPSGAGFEDSDASGLDGDIGAGKSQDDATPPFMGEGTQEKQPRERQTSGGFFAQSSRPSSSQQYSKASSPADWNVSGPSAGFFSQSSSAGPAASQSKAQESSQPSSSTGNIAPRGFFDQAPRGQPQAGKPASSANRPGSNGASDRSTRASQAPSASSSSNGAGPSGSQPPRGFFDQPSERNSASSAAQRPSAGPSGQQVSKPQAQPAAKSKQDSTVSGTVIKTYTTSSGDSTSRSGPGLSGTVYRQNGDAAETGWTRGSAAPIIVALGFLSAAISSLKPFSWRVKQRTGKSEAQRQPATGQSLEISFRGSQPVSAPAAGSTSQAGAERLEKYNIVHDLLCNTTKSPAAQDAKDNPVRGILKGAPAGQISKYDAVGQTVQQLLEAKGPSATPVGAVNSLIEANRENR
ncbi:hypothetical protein WJX74_006800 [Apatococcus lobatus]|uniref:Uncharacterized protein n=1 Tax=Apatococcus lobatus TaxID=904363 RepID=A0AAW1SFJ5_9CHLO